MVVFRYGAVVCFNLSLMEIEQTLEIARRFTQNAYKSATTDGTTLWVKLATHTTPNKLEVKITSRRARRGLARVGEKPSM